MKKLITLILSISTAYCIGQCSSNYVGYWGVTGCGSDTTRYCTATIKTISPTKIMITHFACIPYSVINTIDTVYVDINCANDSLTVEPVTYPVGSSSLIYSGKGIAAPDSLLINYFQINPTGSQYICTVYDNHITGINSLMQQAVTKNVYPNPSNGLLSIGVSDKEQGISKMKIEVYNVLGEQVYSSPLNLPQAGDFQMNLRNQPNGVYFYRVIDENSNLIGQGKLIIQK